MEKVPKSEEQVVVLMELKEYKKFPLTTEIESKFMYKGGETFMFRAMMMYGYLLMASW